MATPGVPVVRADLLAVHALCQEFFPLRDARGREAVGDRRQVRALVNGSLRTFTDIARWNAAVSR
jgi:hypothetical protein